MLLGHLRKWQGRAQINNMTQHTNSVQLEFKCTLIH